MKEALLCRVLANTVLISRDNNAYIIYLTYPIVMSFTALLEHTNFCMG
jgi:hypothetical protein